MKKRVSALFLVMILAISATSCGKSKNTAQPKNKDKEETAEEKETYQFKIWVDETDLSEEDGSWIKTRCDMFAAKYQDDEVLFDYAAYPEEEAAQKMSADRSQAPDIFIFKSSQTDELVENRLLTRLWGETEEYVLSSNTDSIAQLAMYQEKVYGIPISANPYILYYDKRVFTEDDVKNMNTILEKGVLSYPLDDEKYLHAFYEAADVVEMPEEIQNPENETGENEGNPQGEATEEENGETPQTDPSANEHPQAQQTDLSEAENKQVSENETATQENEQQNEDVMSSAEETTENVLSKEDVDKWLIQFRSHTNVVNDSDGTIGAAGLKDGTIQAAVYDYNSYQQMKEILGVNLGMAALPVIQINDMEKQPKCVWETLNIGVNPDCENFEMTIALATYLGSADSQQMHYDMSGVIPVNLTAVQTLMDLDLTRVIAQIADKENPGWNMPAEDEEKNE